jgi:hypothetical protein
MADATSGFNIATNVSDEEELAGFCGLNYGDVRSALKVFCKNGDVEKHFRLMVRYYNGYSFSPYTTTQRVFNTNTCLEYLQVSDKIQRSLSIIEFFLVIVAVFLLNLMY